MVFAKKVIHEGEYVIPTRQTLPINSTPSGENLAATSPKGATPLRLNSPGLHQNESSIVSSSPLKFGNIYSQFESDVESVGSSPPFASTTSLEIQDIPKLIHKWTRTLSILCCVASPIHKLLFCGTQDGKILVYNLSNYSLTREIEAGGQLHQPPSILTICLSKDENYLFVAGSDSLIKVYDLSGDDFHCTHIIYSLVDIGDIFSIAWCDEISTIFVGAQNASILWCKLSFDSDSTISRSNIERLPSFRYNKFFDSKGPGGSQNTLQTKHDIYRKNSSSKNSPHTKHLKLVETKCEDIIRFSHNGFVYCMDIVTAEIGDFHQRKYLISGGGDGMINIWSIDPETGSRPIKLTSLSNEESVLSMTVHSSLLYVGLGNSCVNVWDLTTLQLIRSFQFAAELNEHPHLHRNYTRNSKQHDNEVLSLAIYNDSIFKACSHSGLIKLAMKSKNISLHESILMSNEEEDGIINTVTIFTIDSVTYLLSGGNKSLCLWDISQPIIMGQEANPSSPIVSITDKLTNDNLLSSLKKYISYRTISKDPQLYLEDSRHCAQFLSRLLLDLGAYQTRLLPVHNGNPIVFSVFNKNDKVVSPNKVRLLWYAHYDVVDATNHEAEEWATDPFTMTARDGNLYARGVSDNKGPTLAAIYSVAELYQKQELSCDVVFIIEGEEECGSFGFQQAIQEHRSIIGDIDWIVLSNSYWLDDNTPCLNYGLRGVINASVIIKSDKPDRHSGVDGGVSKEPTMDMMHVLGQLMDPMTGQIQLDNFYDDILPMSVKESGLYEKIHQVIHTTSSTLIRKWREPSLTIHKIQVSGPNNNTVIPQVVHATISIRIVPNQDLASIKQVLINKLQSSFDKLESENSIEINIFHEAEPWLGDPTNKVYSLLYEKVQTHWQQEPLFIREGGSIPSVRFLEKCFNAPAAQIPCGQASDNAHLKDEKLRIINLFKLRLILTDTFKELGRQ